MARFSKVVVAQAIRRRLAMDCGGYKFNPNQGSEQVQAAATRKAAPRALTAEDLAAAWRAYGSFEALIMLMEDLDLDWIEAGLSTGPCAECHMEIQHKLQCSRRNDPLTK